MDPSFSPCITTPAITGKALLCTVERRRPYSPLQAMSRRENGFSHTRIKVLAPTPRGPESSGPRGVGAKTLMRVCEKPFSRRDIACKGEYGLLRSTVQSKALPVIAGVVMHGLKDGSIRTHKPFRSPEGVLLADIPPPVVSRFVAFPPEQLKIHHGVNDGVVSVHAPGCD